MNISIKKATTETDIKKCLAIRNEVFVLEQKVPIELEQDGKDATSDHYLLSIDGKPAGVARIRFVDNYAKIERVAVLKKYQGRGYGHKIMETILFDLKHDTAVAKAKLSAQTYAISFYEKLGFEVSSDEYLDAGIPHKNMELNFKR